MSVLIRVPSTAAVYVAATRQHVGKTSTCLGLLQGLTGRFDRIGFFKPVGQESVTVENGSLRVDKDVAVAKEVFQLHTCNYADMSPVVIMPGYTKRYLDGDITVESQLNKIRTSFKRISQANEFTVVEGTGHTGVGSIVDCNNARIAAELGVDMILVANGGLGSAFDDLALNYSMCKAHGVKIRGVILNKVLESRVEMLQEYFPKAMKYWGDNVPLIGIVPNLPALSNPSMLDFEGLFETEMLTSRTRRFQQYNKTTLVTAGLSRFLVKLTSPEFERTLFVTHVSRNDIIMGFLSHAQNFEHMAKRPYGGGLILTGSPSNDQPQDYIMDIIKNAQAPVLYVPTPSFEVMEKITHFTAKFNPTDKHRVHACSTHYARHLNFDAILSRHEKDFVRKMSVTNPASSLIVRGVTFDLDDTLWCGKTVLRKANDAFHAFLMQKTPQLAQQFPPATFDTLLVEFQQSMPEKAHDYTFLRKHTLNYCINVCGALNLELEDEIQLETFINAAFQAFLIPRSQPELFDGVEHLFQALKQEIREWNQDIDPILGVITNGNCKMENLPEYFNQHMNFIVSAEVVGTAKPNLAIFDAAVAKFPPVNDRQQIVHVGDHYECDVEGAKHAGLRTIWVNAKWTKPNALTRTELDLEDAERYVAADAIVKEVNAVLLVVKHWNMLAASST